jgi:cysteine desulfurase family protein
MPVYFDNAATSYPKPESVYQAVDDYMRDIGSSPGRGTYSMARKAEEVLFSTRAALGRLFSISDVTRIIFTSNVTESINLVLKGFLNPGDHVITTQMEHNALWRPLKVLAHERGVEISVLDCPDGRAFDPGLVENLIRDNTRLIAVNHASNVTGTLMPVKEVGRICATHNIPLLVDAAQTAGSFPIDVEELKISLLAFTGHKCLLGPTGTGGLYIAPGIELKPLKEGGTGGDSLLEHQPDHLPDRFEAGTLNAAGIAGLGAGVKYILDHDLEKIRSHDLELTRYALKQLNDLPGLIIYGPDAADDRTAVISFNFSDIAPEEVTYVLDEVYDIMARSGLHCAPQAHRSIGTVDGGTVRISFGIFNSFEEIDHLIVALKEISLA